MGYRLAAVYAHPDDDTFGIGCVLARQGSDLRYTLVVATSGEAGEISDPSLASEEDLARVREAEELESLNVLGVRHPEVHFLRHPDGGLDQVDRMELVEGVSGILAVARPEVVATFGPEGITRHPDHIAIGQAATQAFHDARAAGANGAFHRLFYNALPESELERYWQALREHGVDRGSADESMAPRGVPDHTITATVDCTADVGRKLDAIRAHRTQANELAGIPEDLIEPLVAREWFVQAWPPVVEPRGPALADLFEGLEG